MQLTYTFSIFSATIAAIFGTVVSSDVVFYVERKFFKKTEESNVIPTIQDDK